MIGDDMVRVEREGVDLGPSDIGERDAGKGEEDDFLLIPMAS